MQTLRATFVRLFLLISGGMSLFADEMMHTDNDCAAVFVGAVIRTEVLKTNTVEGGSVFKWEQWRAEVKVQSVAKQDKALGATVFVYYSHNHSEAGTLYMTACPAPPDIYEALTARFQCVRNEIAGFGRVLCVPSDQWIERASRPDNVQSVSQPVLKPEPSIPKRLQDPTRRGWRLQR